MPVATSPRGRTQSVVDGVDFATSHRVGFPPTPEIAANPTKESAGQCAFPSYRLHNPVPVTQSTTRIDAPSLPESVTLVNQIQGTWLAVACAFDLRGSRDAAVAWAAYLAEQPFYYPQRVGWVIQGGKRRRKRMSLFPGYVFLAGPDADKWARESELILDVLYEVRQDDLRGDLAVVERALQLNPALTSTEIRNKGQKVRITRGPFMNYEGIVESLREDNGGVVKVDVELKFMGKPLTMELLRDDLEAVTPPGALVVR